MRSSRRAPALAAVAAALAAALAATLAAAAPTSATNPRWSSPAPRWSSLTRPPAHAPAPRWTCPPDARAVGFSDALDKRVVDGVTLGGLSDLARDRRTRSWVSTVDNHDTDPARLWSFRRLADPRVVGDAVVLRRPDGTAYTGETGDFEGLAVLRSGRFLVSSETEPSIRVFGRRGHQRGHLRVPARFRVAPAGQATDNATLEGLTLTPGKRRAVAAMEGVLGGDVSASGDDTYRRWLVYDQSRGGRLRLTRQVGYRVDEGMRIAEVTAYARDRALVLEAAFDPAIGNTIRLYAVTGLGRARDVSGVPNLSDRPGAVVGKRLVADVTACTSLGATNPGTQVNPLMDNFEALAVRPRSGHRYRVTLLSDDNFNDTQVTRVLRLVARLP